MRAMRRCCRAALFFCALTFTAHAFGSQANGPLRVVAGQARAPIHLDGVLDEAAWQQAALIPNLSQQSPHPGGPTPFRTEVRILVDGDTLYLGVTCFDPEPSRIAVHTMQRDGDMDGDDTVAFVLDTFGDRVTGYYFRVNAAGAHQDGVYSDPENIPLDWDGIWDVRARTGPEGWTAEIAIPARTLRFPTGQSFWGFNIERSVPRDRVTLRLAGISLDARLADLRRDAELAGVGELRQGLGLSISPYALIEATRDFVLPDSETKPKAGLDVTYNLGPALTGVVTVNTDFAETEVDTRQINLTRFPLFYPEKRQFFTDGSNQFDFGIGIAEEFIPFFSRRVGLYNGEQVPLLGGVKLIGREGRWGVGVLDVQTDDIPGAPGSNLFAGRVTYDVDEHLRVGAIATNGNPDGVDANYLGGVDAIWRTSTFRGDKNFTVGAWAAGSGGDLREGNRAGYGFKIDYPNDLWDLMLTFKQFGDALDPALGFLPRPGIRSYSAGMAYQPRPQSGWWATWVRQLFFELEPTLITGLDGRTQTWTVFTAPFNAETKWGDHLEFNWQPEYEFLTEPFEIYEGVVIPPGSYRFDRFRAEVETSLHRPWQVGTEVWFGTFYSGHMIEWEQWFAYTTPEGHLQLGFTMEDVFGYLPEGDFIERLFQLKVVYAFTPDLILSYYGQYDNESENLGANARLRWTIRPGTDFYVVWNHNWAHPEDSEDWWTLTPVSDQVIVKLRYTWRS
jgi:Domain of unknown function (DUF5916)